MKYVTYKIHKKFTLFRFLQFQNPCLRLNRTAKYILKAADDCSVVCIGRLYLTERRLNFSGFLGQQVSRLILLEDSWAANHEKTWISTPLLLSGLPLCSCHARGGLGPDGNCVDGGQKIGSEDHIQDTFPSNCWEKLVAERAGWREVKGGDGGHLEEEQRGHLGEDQGGQLEEEQQAFLEGWKRSQDYVVFGKFEKLTINKSIKHPKDRSKQDFLQRPLMHVGLEWYLGPTRSPAAIIRKDPSSRIFPESFCKCAWINSCKCIATNVVDRWI